MFLIREAGPADFRDVFELARILDSYNLPADRRLIRELLAASERSFRGKLPREKARYLFGLEAGGRVVGCSLIIAKHGTPGRPHLWFSQERVTRRSRTLGIRRSHAVLRMGGTEDGPTEVGGFVLLPRYRGRPERCALQLSYARFLYMAAHPERFEREVLIEYRGAMGAGGKSPFWEAVGKVFTGLSYARADRLSVTNKEFIRSLLPAEPIYCALLPGAVQRAIGAIHPAAVPAAALAARIGFKPLRQVEPFDGGPYYSARRRRISVVRATRRLKLLRGPAAGDRLTLAASEEGGLFRAVLARGEISPDGFRIEREGFLKLGAPWGGQVYVCGIPR